MRWFTADLHLGHTNIIKYEERPFSDVDWMDTALVERWNDTVDDDDDVYVLGDLAMGKIRETVPKCKQLRGRKFLVPGNHDRCWPGHKKVSEGTVELYAEAGFHTCAPQMTVAFEGAPRGRVMLCHFPYAGDSQDEDRYLEYRPRNTGDWLLHGHVHSRWKINGRQINVGVDVWDFYPVSENDLIRLMEAEGA